MNNQVAVIDDFNKSMIELEQTQQMCHALLRTAHYAKIGEIGIFTIIQKARSIGLNPLDALNGGMYFVNGKVELAANTMNYMIRSQGHSIIKDEKSTSECCILKGKRADNGDTWIASFSIKEAKIAGIYKNTWEKYPEDMLFARALTRLARQLFPDVIKGCYVEGEIRDALPAEKSFPSEKPLEIDCPKPETISAEQAQELCFLLKKCKPAFQEEIRLFCKKSKFGDDLEGLPVNLLERLKKAMTKNLEEITVDCQEETIEEKQAVEA